MFRKQPVIIRRAMNLSTAAEINKKAYYKKKFEISQEKLVASEEEWKCAKPYKAIPGPKPVPIFGNLWRFFMGELNHKNMKDMFDYLYKTYGEIVAIRGLFVKRDIVFLFSPDVIEKLFRNEGVWPIRDAIHSIKYYRKANKHIFQDTPGLSSVQGEEWFNFRSKVNPILMQPSATKQYIPQMDEIANEFIQKMDKLAANDSILPENFENEIHKWAFESVFYISMDKRLGCLEDNTSKEAQDIINAVLAIFEQMYILDLRPSFWKIYNTKSWKIFVKNMDFLVGTLLKYIDEAAENFKKNPKKPKKDQSICEKFLSIDRKVAVSMAIDMITAGIDTTSKTVSATMYFLAKNESVQFKLYEELKALMPSKDTPITEEILTNAQYLKATIKETMRFAPPAIGNIRTTTNKLVLGGYQIPEGVEVISGTIVVCNHDEFCEKSKEYIPERFLRESTNDKLLQKSMHPFIHLPFGFGPRSCVGMRLANLEMEIVLAKILRNYHLEWPHEDMKFATTLIYGIADPLKFKITPRIL